MAVATLDISLDAGLTEEDARAIFAQGEEAVVFTILELCKRLAEQKGIEAANSHQTRSTPSGMKPPYSKCSPSGRGRKKPGRKPGHPGARRKAPEHIDWESEHRADCCPDCGGPLNRCEETRTRYTEDIPDIEPEVTEHTIHRDWCPNCRKKVEPPVPDALPGATLGNRVLVLSAWLHYALGNTLSQIVEVFNFHLQIPLSQGGLVQMWYRLQAILFAWYEEIQQEALKSAVLHADETGWRVNGKTLWLWCFTTRNLTYYMINRSRGSPALMNFFLQEFAGVLVTDSLGSLQRRRMRVSPDVLGAPAARVGTYRKIQVAGQELARLCQKTSAAAWRCDSAVETTRGTFPRNLRLAPPATDGSAPGVDRYGPGAMPMRND